MSLGLESRWLGTDTGSSQWLGSKWEKPLLLLGTDTLKLCFIKASFSYSDKVGKIRYSFTWETTGFPPLLYPWWCIPKGTRNYLNYKADFLNCLRSINNENSASSYNTQFCAYFEPVANIFPKIQWVKMCIDIKLENLNLAQIAYAKNVFQKLL